MVGAEDVLFGGGLWAENVGPVVVVEGTMENDMFHGVSDG